jgi:sortase B
MGRKIRTLLVSFIIVVLLGVAAYAGYQLYTSHRAYAQGDETYEEIARQVIRQAPVSAQETEPEATPEPDLETAEPTEEISSELSPSQAPEKQLSIPEHNVDFAALTAINGDAIGWLYCPDTVIDYPVMGAENYTYYLRHLPDGTYNINGSLFLDYSCQRDFSDPLSVIYGHNMKTEKMFGTLVNYKNQAYFDQHPYLYLYTPSQNYRIALLYGAVVSAEAWTREGMNENEEALMAYAAEHTTFQSPEEYTGAENLVVLSTCSYEYENARYFVVGLLQPEYG